MSTSGTTGNNRRAVVVVVVLGYALHVAWRLWLSRGAVVPTAHPDEDGYLLAARALAGGAGGYSTENGPFRRLGLPLLLVPVYWPGHEAFAVYRRAVLLMAALNSAVFPLAAVFARRVLGLSRWWAVGVAFVVGAFPAVVFYSGMVMTDAILPPLVIGWLVLLAGWVMTDAGRARWWYACGAGAVAGLTYAVHVRGTMVLAVHCLLAVGLAVSRRVRTPLVLGAVATAAALAALDPLAKRVVGSAIVTLGSSPGSQLPTALTVDWGVALVLLRCLGQLWYLGIGTLGLGIVGLVAAIRPALAALRLRRPPSGREELARSLVLLAALAVTCLVALGSASSLPFGERRVSYFTYPRYLHFLYPLWFLVGFWALRSRAGVARLRVAVAGAVTLGLAAVVTGWRVGQAAGYDFVPFDVPEALALSGRWDRLLVLPPTLAALGLLALIVAAQYRRSVAPAALVVVVALGAVGASAIGRHITTPMIDYQYPPGTPRLVQDLGLGPGDVVAEAWQVRFPFLFNHAREITWHRLLVFDAAQSPPATATVVIGPWYPGSQLPSWDGTRHGMRQIAADPAHGWAVWRRAGT